MERLTMILLYLFYSVLFMPLPLGAQDNTPKHPYVVAGLIAPRYLLAVNGRKDTLHEASSIERAAAQVRVIYKAAGYPNRFQHRWGDEGHRFYSKLNWPFVKRAVIKP